VCFWHSVKTRGIPPSVLLAYHTLLRRRTECAYEWFLCRPIDFGSRFPLVEEPPEGTKCEWSCVALVFPFFQIHGGFAISQPQPRHNDFNGKIYIVDFGVGIVGVTHAAKAFHPRPQGRDRRNRWCIGFHFPWRELRFASNFHKLLPYYYYLLLASS